MPSSGLQISHMTQPHQVTCILTSTLHLAYGHARFLYIARTFQVTFKFLNFIPPTLVLERDQ